MNIKETAEFLRNHNGYLILTHKNPDGDTIGCAASLCRMLRESGKEAYILPNADMTERFEEFTDGLWAVDDYSPETVVSVDVAGPSMFTQNAEKYIGNVDLAIDHHGTHETFEKNLCLYAECAACGEIIYRIGCEPGFEVSRTTASALYMAITTDTGCFRYSNTTPDTLRICADLIAKGIPSTYINKKFFRTKSLARVRVEARIMSEMEVYDGGLTAIVAITDKLMKECGAGENDVEDIASLAGEVEGVHASVTIRQKGERKYKISLRTWADLDASKVCALLGGGGHKAASGCTVEGTLDETKKMILDAIHKIREENPIVMEEPEL